MLMATSNVTIRLGSEADAPAVAGIHVRAWRWAYRGLLPDDFLDALGTSLERREAFWRGRFGPEAAEERLWVAEVDGRVVGFSHTRPSQEADATPDTAELTTIYLEPEVVGTGIGRALFTLAVEDLRRRGFRAITLWMLDSNARARRFYEIAGWRPDGAAKTDTVRGVELREVRYRIDLS